MPRAAGPGSGGRQLAGVELTVLGFAAAVFVFHQLPALVGPGIRGRRPILRAAASAFALGALLIGVWAVWQGASQSSARRGWL